MTKYLCGRLTFVAAILLFSSAFPTAVSAQMMLFNRDGILALPLATTQASHDGRSGLPAV